MIISKKYMVHFLYTERVAENIHAKVEQESK